MDNLYSLYPTHVQFFLMHSVLLGKMHCNIGRCLFYKNLFFSWKLGQCWSPGGANGKEANFKVKRA